MLRRLIIIATLATVSSHTASISSLLPIPNRQRQEQQLYSETVRNTRLEKAILETMPEYREKARSNPDYHIWYYYNKVDLNGDGTPELLVYLRGREVCGTGGCNLMVFQFNRSSYRLISDITLANNPIIVSGRRTRGWSDLLVYVVGGGVQPGYYALLQFNGKKYPENATDGIRLRSYRVKGKAYIADDIPRNPGILLPTD